MKVGQLAERTGLTVRALHHYDELGLLRPDRRTAAGHRLYGEAEVRRLQQIVSLRHLGLSLDEIGDCLDGPDHALERVLDLHIDRIDRDIGRQRRIRALIVDLRNRLGAAEGVSVEQLTRTIEATVNFEKYYTPEQLAQLDKRRETVGEDRIREVEQEWKTLFADFTKAMGDGLDPASPGVATLARRAVSLIAEFTGGDEGIRESLAHMYRSEGAGKLMANQGIQMAPGLWEYMGRARAALDS